MTERCPPWEVEPQEAPTEPNASQGVAGDENATTGLPEALAGAVRAFVDGSLVRMLRGRSLIALDASELGEHQTAGGVWVPGSAVKPREQKSHRGTILALGPPARQGRGNGPEIPWDCKPGDRVVFVYAVWLERMRKFDGIAVVAQAEVLGVIEDEPAAEADEPAAEDVGLAP